MHRNLVLLLIALAVFAALIVGVNIGKRVGLAERTNNNTTPTPVTTSPSSTVTPVPMQLAYSDPACGITFQYPSTIVKQEVSSASATFANVTNPTDTVTITCQQNIPRPPIVSERIETLLLKNIAGTASVSAKIYHDASAKDGTPIDKLIFRQPKTGMDVFISGFGSTFITIIQNLSLYP